MSSINCGSAEWIPEVRCWCGEVAPIRMSWSYANPGKRCRACPRYGGNGNCWCFPGCFLPWEPPAAVQVSLELSKLIFQIGVMATVAVVALRSHGLEAVDQIFVLGNVMGCACIFGGLLLRESTPIFARTAELLGVGLVFAGVFVLFSKHLLWWLRIVPAVCYAFVLIAMVVAAKGEEGDSLEELFYCII